MLGHEGIRLTLFRILLGLFVGLVPVSQLYSSRVLIALVLFMPFSGFGFSLKATLRNGWDILFFMAVLAGGLTYSSDFALGLRQIETSISLLGLLFVFSFPNSKLEITRDVFLPFAGGVVLASMICLSNAVYSFVVKNDIRVFFFDQFTEIIDSHPTYFSYYVIFTITFLLFRVHFEPIRPSRFAFPVIVFLFFILVLLGGQTIFISLLLIIAFFLLSFLLGERSTRDIWLFGFSFTMLIALFAVVGLMQTRPEFITISDRNDYWERFQLWTAALEANVHWFVGVGTGDYNQVLGSFLRSHGFEEYASRSLNAHNQFIQILFSNGILGLLGVAMLLGRPLVLFMRVRYELGILAIFPFLVYGVTEVFLGRYQGVVFFALLHQLFLNEYFRNKMLPIWRENSAKI